MEESTSLRLATLESMIALATRLAYLSCFSCSTGSPLLMTGPPKVIQSRKSLKDSILVVSARMVRRSSIEKVAQQEQGALDAAEFAESEVEAAFPVVRAELSQQHRGQDQPGLDREHHLHHVRPMRRDQLPVDLLGEEGVDMLVARGLVRTVEDGVAQLRMRGISLMPSSRHSPKTGSLWPWVSAWSVSGWIAELVLHQPVQDVDCLPDAAGDEAGEQRDVAVGDVVVGDAAVAAVADVLGADQVVLAQRDMGAVGDRRAAAPQSLGRAKRA